MTIRVRDPLNRVESTAAKGVSLTVGGRVGVFNLDDLAGGEMLEIKTMMNCMRNSAGS